MTETHRHCIAHAPTAANTPMAFVQVIVRRFTYGARVWMRQWSQAGNKRQPMFTGRRAPHHGHSRWSASAGAMRELDDVGLAGSRGLPVGSWMLARCRARPR